MEAVYRTSSPVLDDENYKLSQAAINKRLPMVAATSLDEGVLLTCATSIFEMGRHSSRLVDRNCKGMKPEDLPIETAEIFLTINLSTAEKIGLHIPDVVLMNAKKIIR